MKTMSSTILTWAGLMFGVPLLAMLATAAVSDVPGPMLTIGGWSMGMSIMVGAAGIFVGMTGN